MARQKWKELLIHMLRLYTLLVTLITVLIIVLGNWLDHGRVFSYEAFFSLLLYALIILADSTLKNRSLRVGLLSVPAAFVQLIGYGTGFLRAWWQRCVLGRGEFEAFKKNFYK